jgi:hypothetical protein
MLLPTVNLVNLNISRIMERASEIGARKAFGASSWVIILQFMLENLVLTFLSGDHETGSHSLNTENVNAVGVVVTFILLELVY